MRVLSMTSDEFGLFVFFFCVFFGAFIVPLWAIIMLVTGNFEKEEEDFDDEDLRY